METIFDLPVVALRNVPESIISKLHQVTTTATGYSAANPNSEDAATSTTSSKSSPLVILDGTKIVSRIHLGAAIRKTLMNVVAASSSSSSSANSQNNNNNNNTVVAPNLMSPSQLIEASSRMVSPRRLQSPPRLSSPSRQQRGTATTKTTQQQQNQDSAVPVPQQQQQHNKKPRIASQLVFTLNTSKTNAVKNFVLVGENNNNNNNNESATSSTTTTATIHPSVVIVFDSEIVPSEAWRWVRAAGAMGFVVSLDNLQSTVNADEVCKIYGLDPSSELSSSLSRGSTNNLGNLSSAASQFGHQYPASSVPKNSTGSSNMPCRNNGAHDVSWLERQVVSKIATNGL